MSKILFVDDDENLLAMVEAFFKTEKYTVETAKCVEDAEDILAVSKFDIIVVDWMMPGKSGLQLVQQVRSQRDRTPIIMLTGQSAMDDKEAGLDGGADDYLTKPFAMRELSVRVRALLRRAAPEVSQVLIAGQINLDTKTRTCTVNGATIFLLPKEYSLLEFLMRHPNETFSNDNANRARLEVGHRGHRSSDSNLRDATPKKTCRSWRCREQNSNRCPSRLSTGALRLCEHSAAEDTPKSKRSAEALLSGGIRPRK
ncbi:response regulator transcription factor [Candidatus Obscuribacterales bacterium]|nr:response regulator transcription factor [Candidatus Obscuribacterales bacterium]